MVITMGLKPTLVTYTGMIAAAVSAGKYPVAYGFFNRYVGQAHYGVLLPLPFHSLALVSSNIFLLHW